MRLRFVHHFAASEPFLRGLQLCSLARSAAAWSRSYGPRPSRNRLQVCRAVTVSDSDSRPRIPQLWLRLSSTLRLLASRVACRLPPVTLVNFRNSLQRPPRLRLQLPQLPSWAPGLRVRRLSRHLESCTPGQDWANRYILVRTSTYRYNTVQGSTRISRSWWKAAGAWEGHWNLCHGTVWI